MCRTICHFWLLSITSWHEFCLVFSIQLILVSRARFSSGFNFQRCVQSLVPIKDLYSRSAPTCRKHPIALCNKNRHLFSPKPQRYTGDALSNGSSRKCFPFEVFESPSLYEPRAYTVVGWFHQDMSGNNFNSPAKTPQLPKWFCIAWKTDSSVTWDWSIIKVSDKICPYLKGPSLACCACWGSATRYSINPMIRFPPKAK